MHPVAFCRWTGCTQWFCLKDFVCSVYIKIVINNQNSCLCSNWKRYEIGPWLPWITNGKSQVANQSVSVSMNDLQKWNARDQIFLVDRCNYGHTVWPRMTWLIWLDDTWWRSIFQWGQPHPVLKIFWDLLHARTQHEKQQPNFALWSFLSQNLILNRTIDAMLFSELCRLICHMIAVISHLQHWCKNIPTTIVPLDVNIANVLFSP